MEISSPFGGIPRNWKRLHNELPVADSTKDGSPFGGIPRNWKPSNHLSRAGLRKRRSPFGGIPRNWKLERLFSVPPDGTKFPLRGDP